MSASAERAIPTGGPAARRVRSRSEGRRASADRIGDFLLHALCAFAALLTVAVIVGIAYEVFDNAGEAISRFGLGFLVHTDWAPNFNKFGAAPYIFGTAVTSLIALLLAVPIGISIGLYLSTVAHRRVRGVVGPLVETLAAIPSVILGFWGIIVLGPFLHSHIEPALHSAFGFLPIFGVPAATGASVLNAGLIVAIMVIPIVASISRDLFATVPRELRDGATALGATQWEVVRGVMLPSAASGIVSATFLGLGRALGEAIAITQVIGAGSAIHASLFSTGDPGWLDETAERGGTQSAEPRELDRTQEPDRAAESFDLFAGLASHLPDPAGALTATGHLRRRQAVNRIMQAGQTTAALFAVGVLAIVVYSVAARGASALSLSFLTKDPPVFEGVKGGGIAPEIVGTALMMLVAAAVAMPLGVMTALYLTEFAGRRAGHTIGLALDLLNGMPTIVIGLFFFGLLVVGKHQSGFAGSLALAIIMLPLIARATQEVLVLVPSGLREAADALGVSRWRAVRGVVLPSALGGILTATVLAVARAAGETAPLIFLTSIFGHTASTDLFGEALPNIPVYIFTASEAADPYGFERAWGAGLVLLIFILITSIAGRALLGRSRMRAAR